MNKALGSTEKVGATDTRDYALRRHAIAELQDSRNPCPRVDYLPYEDEVWEKVTTELAPLHRARACAEFNVGADTLDLGSAGVPQLQDVSDSLIRTSAFRLQAAPGIVAPRDFYGVLEARGFMSAQFIRDADSPFFSPDPDILHELVGHANALANPRIADIYEAAGAACNRLVSDKTVEAFSRLFWFTFETGLVREKNEIKAFGAALLSSVGEMRELLGVRVKDVTDLIELVEERYDITEYQPTLFVFRSFDNLEDNLLSFFEQCDEETMESWLRSSGNLPS